MTKGLITTTVGSFPKPPYLQKARNQFSAGKLSREELDELERQATREVIALQEEIGIDILVDGEMARGDMVVFFAEHLEGMEVGGLVRSYGNRYYHKPVVKGRVRWTAPMTVDMWRYAQSLTDKPVKGMLTGPYTMVEWSFLEGYDDFRSAVLEMARAVNHEALELDRAGATFIQIDEPALSTRLDDIDLAIEAMGIATEGLKAQTATHVCYGDFVSAYPRFFDMPVKQFDMEMANSSHDLVELLKTKGFPEDKEIAWGVVDVHSHEIETVDQVVAEIKRGLEVLPPERLYIDPDCGLKTRTWDESADKLRVIAQAVAQVKSELGIE
ncbi:MAG: methionine synthase [Chloroflexi bacterium]|nr:methionine synthase [Chloroflexota bacterium]